MGWRRLEGREISGNGEVQILIDAVAEVDTDGRKYVISLCQPAKKGSGGLWVLKSIQSRE